MLKRLLTTLFFVGAVFGLTSGANAQVMRITTDNPTDSSRLRASGTTILTLTMDTTHDLNGSLQTCNSHTSVNCGAPTTGQNLDMFSYTIALKATGGTVTWGTFTAADVAYTDTSPQIQNSTEVEINKSRPTGTFTAPGLSTLGTLPVTIASGSPTIGLQIGAGALNPYGFGNGFGTSCDAFFFGNTYVLGDPTDPCGNTIGIAGDWFDFVPALPPAAVNTPPVLAQPANMTVNEGAIADQPLSATDADGNPLTFSKVSGPTYATVTTTTPGTGTATGNLHLAPGFTDAGTATVTVQAADASTNNQKSLTVTVNNVNRAPTLNQPANMTVAQGATADQVITGSDPDGDPLTFTKVSGPTFMTVTTTTATTGNIHLAAGAAEPAGTSSATVQAADATLNNQKSLTITVTAVNHAPVLAQPANMTVNEGATADQALSATDSDGNPLAFTLVSGPTYATVSTTTPGTGTAAGNIHLAPGFSDAGTASATVQAADASLNNQKSLTITVNNTNRAPVLTQPTNMTVAQGATADQVITGSDPDGDALTFTKVSGPTFMTVTTTTATTGNIHLAAGAAEPAGTSSATVQAADATLNNQKSLTITVTAVNHAPVLAQPANMTVNEGATADQALSATDQDANPLTFSLVSGPTYATVTTTTPGTGTGTGNIHLAPGFSDAGTASATVQASDGSLNNQKSLTITVNNTNRAPVLTQPANMTVNEGATADQVLNATDADGQALTFSLVSGPTYATVSTTTPGTGTATGNIHLAPGFTDAGTASATVQASDGALNNQKSLTITVNNTNRAPTLNQPANMTVNEGATADQAITGSDPDGDALTFTKVSGPTYLTVTTTNATTGNIHLAPGFSDAGTAAATVQAADATLNNQKSLTVTVNNVNRAPTLNQPANMTVAQGATADQVISGTDPDGDALTFTKISGATFMTVTTTNATTGNIHLAAGISEPVGTSSATVQAADATLNNQKSLTITVTATNHAPVLAQPANMTVNEGATADQALSATDSDGNPLTFSLVSGPTYASVTTTTPGTGTATGNIHLAPGFSNAGTASATVQASDGSLNNQKSLTITVNNTNQAPVLTQPANMTVNEGATADQAITGSDPDGDALTFTKVSGPTYLTVTTTNATTGNIHLAPGFSDAGTASATVQAADATLNNQKSLTVTVNNVNRAPTLNQPANMTVAEGATADQAITGSDPDGDALTFTLVSGPTYATVSTTNATTGNIHLAPGFSDAGTASATVQAADATLNNQKSLTITVTNTDRAVALNAIGNMTVAAGSTADQTFTATDADGDAISFTSTGPAFMTRTDNAQVTTTRTGNIHLAPALGTSGTFNASVTATANATSANRTFLITVTATNQAPTLAQPANMTVNEGATADQALSATDPDGNALTFSLVSGPTYATVTTTTPGTGTGTGNIHLAPGFSDAGTASATVQASDGSLNNQKSLTITVNNTNRAPVLTQPANMTVNEGATADQVLNATDADGQALTFSLVSGPTYATVSTTTPGTGTATGNIHLAPGFSDAGTASATVQASDGALNNQKSLTITVNNVNRAPTLNQPANMTVNEGATADQAITGSDPDGDALTFTLVSGPTYASVTTTNATTGNIHLAPGFSDAGTASATVQAADATLNNQKSLTITVNNVNRAPTLNQPANMSVAQGATADQVITGSDPDGDALTFTKISGPTFMTVTTTNATTGNIHLAAGISEPIGTSSATVQAADATLNNQKSLTITVTATNHAPVLAQPANMTVNEGATADQALSATDSDGNPLTFSLVSGPAYATVTTTTPGTGTGTGNIHLAPGFSDAGTASATVQASDGSLNNQKSLTITVNNTNQAPVLAQPANMTVNEGATADQVLNATDADGQALTFSLVSGPTYATVSTTTPGTGTATGNIHLAPGFSDAGTASATVQASDGALNNQKSLTITVNNVNRAPTLNQPANMTVNEGATADQAITGTDPDGNALTFTLVSGPTYASVTTTNATTGNIHLAPGFSDAGTASATVQASDGSLNNQKSLTITVNNVNRAPTLNQPANMTVAQGATADQVITGSDPDGDALTFTKVSGPTFMTVTTTNATTGNIHLAAGTLEPIGTSSATVQAADATLNNQKSLTITVTATNHAPVLAQPANMTVNEGVTADQALSATDSDGNPLTFSLVSGPAYATVTTTTPGTGTGTGNIHLAPGFTDAGTASATVQASDGSLNNQKSLTITVNNVNRAPTLNQPANMTVAQGATADQIISGSDPDGDALTFTKVSGPTFMTVTTTTGTTGNIHLAAGASEPVGTSSATVQAADATLNNQKSLTITVTATNHAPVLAQPANMTVNEGVTADQALSATDQDANPLTFTLVSGPTYATVSTTTPGTGTATGNIHLAPGFSDAGTASASVRASDGSLSDTKSLTITVNPVNRAPVLNAIANMTVNEGATADQTITGSDAEGDVLTFSKVSGPSFMTVTTTNATTGNVHLAPGFSDAGTYSASASASDGLLSDTKSFSITVNNVDRAPVMNAVANQTVAEGATADVAVSATDVDGDVITLSATLPSFATLTSVPAAGTVNGSIHIAPNFGDAAGSPYSASVTASSGTPALTNSKSFTITVTGTNRPPVLAQPSNMTVDEGMTADQVLTASDPDGNPLTFTKVSGPLFLTVTTTTATTGNAHLAPGFSDAGVSSATVRVSDGSLTDQKSFSITVNNVNRAPIANAGGPYSGTIGVPVPMDGTGSTDPDGDVLTYAWDFGDANTGTGATTSHAYATAGHFIVSLMVTDNGTPALSNTATTTADITNELPSTVFTNGTIRLASGKPKQCFQIQPIGGDYANTDVVLSSIVATYNAVTVPSDPSKTTIDGDKNGDGIPEIAACFTKANLRILFSGLPSGHNSVTIHISGTLTNGSAFGGDVTVDVVSNGSFAAVESSVSPNPLNPATTLYFITSKSGTVRVDMFDLQGRLVRTLQGSTYMTAGQHELRIDGRGQSGEKLASGVYFVRGETADGTFKNAITILK